MARLVQGWCSVGVAVLLLLLLSTAVAGNEVERVTTEAEFVLDGSSPSHTEYFETEIEENMIWVELLAESPVALDKDTVGLVILFYNVIEMSTPLLHLSYSVQSITKLLDKDMFFSWGPCSADLLAYSTDEDGDIVTSGAALTTMDGTWAMEAFLDQPDGTNSTVSFHVVIGSGQTAINPNSRYSDSFATTDLYYTIAAPVVEDSMLVLSMASVNESVALSDWLRALYWRKDGCPIVTEGGGNQTFLQGSVMSGPSVDIYLGSVDGASYLALGVWSSYAAASNGSEAFTLAYETIAQESSAGASPPGSSPLDESQLFVDVLFIVMVGVTFCSICTVIVVVVAYAFIRTRQLYQDPDESALPISVNTSEETPIVGSAGPATLRYVE